MEQRIEGLIEHSSAGSDGTSWSLILFLRPWRATGEAACNESLRVLVPMSEAEAKRQAFRSDGMAVAFTLVTREPPATGNRFGVAFGRGPLEEIELDAELRALAAVEHPVLSVDDPVLGTLVLDRSLFAYETTRQHEGGSYEISVEIDDLDDVAAAAQAIARARPAIEHVDKELDALRGAVADELLDEYNDRWRRGRPRLSREAFTSRLALTAITATADEVTAWLACDGMFGDHGVQVTISPGGEILDIEIS